MKINMTIGDRHLGTDTISWLKKAFNANWVSVPKCLSPILITMTLLMITSAHAATDITSGKVVLLDGVDDYVEVNRRPELEPTVQVSFEAWGYMDDWKKGTGRTAILDKSDHGAGGYGLWVDGAPYTPAVQAVVRVNCSGMTFITASYNKNILSNGWHHFTGTYDNRYLKLYVDGVLQKTTDATATCGIAYPYRYVLRFGHMARTDAGGGSYFIGRIDEARIYNRALSAAEVTNHYNTGLGQYGSPENGLVGGWHFDEDNGTTINDYSGNNSSGVLLNGAQWVNRNVPAHSVLGISVSNITTTSATINWTSTDTVDSKVDYGISASYGSSITDPLLATVHSLKITGLSPGSIYHFSVGSGDNTFTTLFPAPIDNQFYVAPDGTAVGNGSKGSPWDLQTALSHPAAVLPGATIWLKEGSYSKYSGVFTSTLVSTAQKPIVVRAIPGNRVIIENGIQASSNYVWYWGFEITNAKGNHISMQNPSVTTGLDLRGKGNRAINLIVHDAGHPGIGFWEQGDGGEIYGSLMWANGIYDYNRNTVLAQAIGIEDTTITLGDATNFGTGSILIDKEWMKIQSKNGNVCTVARGQNGTVAVAHNVSTPVYLVWTRGDAVYSQNMIGNVYFEDNVAFNNFTTGIKGFGETGYFNGLAYEGNMIFGSGDKIFLGGGSKPLDMVSIKDNYLYTSINKDEGNSIRLGYVTKNNYYAQITNNVIVGGRTLILSEFQDGKVMDNFFQGEFGDQVFLAQKTGGFNNSFTYQWDGNTYVSSRKSIFGLTGASNAFGGGLLSFDEQPVFRNNVLVGQGWRQWTGYDQHSQKLNTPSVEMRMVTRCNLYEPGRANIVVYNWTAETKASIDVTACGLKPGDQFEIRDAQAFLATPVVKGTVSAQKVEVPLQGTESSPSPGIFHLNLQHTSSFYNVFVLLRVAQQNPPANMPPIARDQLIAYYADAQRVIPLMVNDPDRDSVTVQIVTQPLHGTVQVITGVPLPSVVYTPQLGYASEDFFQYKVTDGQNASAVATVTLKSATPVRAKDLTMSTQMGQQVLVTLAADAPQDHILQYVPIMRPAHGSITPVDPNDYYYYKSGWYYTPSAGFEGVDTFTYMVHSQYRFSLEAKVRITVGNVASIAYGDVSGDGKVTMYDAALVLRFTLGANLTDAQKQKADMNADGKIDGADVVAIAKKGLGL